MSKIKNFQRLFIIIVLCFNLNACAAKSIGFVADIISILQAIFGGNSDKNKNTVEIHTKEVVYVTPTPTSNSMDNISNKYEPIYTATPSSNIKSEPIICPEFEANELLKKGKEHYRNRNYSDSIYQYNKIISICSDKFGEPYYEIGNSYLALKDYTKAHENFEKAIMIDSFKNKSSAYYNNACTYSLENNLYKAIEQLKQAIDLDFRIKTEAKNDSDFDNIKNTSEFINLVN